MSRFRFAPGSSLFALLAIFGLLLAGCPVGDDDDTTANDDDAAADDDDATSDDDDATSDDDDATSDDDDATTPADADGDGWEAPADCDDTSAVTFPGAQELCDSVDNDCDGASEDSSSPLCTCAASLTNLSPESATALCWGILGATGAESEQGWPAAVATALAAAGDGTCPGITTSSTPLPGACGPAEIGADADTDWTGGCATTAGGTVTGSAHRDDTSEYDDCAECYQSDSDSDSVTVSAMSESDASGAALFAFDGSAAKSGATNSDVCPNYFTNNENDSWSVDVEGWAPALPGLLGSLAMTAEFDFSFTGSVTLTDVDDSATYSSENEGTSAGTLLVGSTGRPWEATWSWPREWGINFMGNDFGCESEGDGTLTVTRRETPGGPVVDEMQFVFSGTACDNCGDVLWNNSPAGTYCR